MSLVKSKRRVADHGEVFTPPEIVESMLDLVKAETVRIDARFLEPACGSGNFLVPVLHRKLSTVENRYAASEFERNHHALLALMSIYGIELLADNVAECRATLLAIFTGALRLGPASEWTAAAKAVLELNIVHGDALSMTTQGPVPQPITFAEWSYMGKGRYHRRDFRYDTLTQMSSYGAEDTLFADLGKHEIFTPTRDHGTLSVAEIAVGPRMPEQVGLRLRNRNPDVLTCIANLSNDEVFTPPELANQMLDLVAAWADAHQRRQRLGRLLRAIPRPLHQVRRLPTRDHVAAH